MKDRTELIKAHDKEILFSDKTLLDELQIQEEMQESAL
jgi:hypothetical protein